MYKRQTLGLDRLSILFEGVYMDNEIYLNGEKIFTWPYGYSQFEIDLTSYVKEGENTIWVKNTYELPNSRWYPGSGIYRNVWLDVLPFISQQMAVICQQKKRGMLLFCMPTTRFKTIPILPARLLFATQYLHRMVK